MKKLIIGIICLFLAGCVTSSTPPMLDTQVTVIEPISQRGSVVVETQGNVTRIYSKKGE